MLKRVFILIFFLKVLLLYAQNNTLATGNGYFNMPAGISQEQYIPNTIIFKINEQYRSQCNGDEIDIPVLQNIFSIIKTETVVKKFLHAHSPFTKCNSFGQNYVDLSLIYEVQYSSAFSLQKAINALISTGVVQYAVPHYLPHLLGNPVYIPNDSKLSLQYNLRKVRAFEGWYICKGDTNTVIGISDTGTDIDHPDLVGNIKYNYADPINGIDDDNDGYIDNFRGWNLGENNNNPQAVAVLHGIHVSGIAAATTDNNTGIAGAGFRCKFLPVKIDDANGNLVMSYESIVYAADHGCNIINCSWGDTISPGAYGQDIINYATINRNVLVVAAAGNSNTSVPWYPASYNYVISVAGTDSNDVKWNQSSYGNYVDVCAPSIGIWSTWDDGQYISSGGTSMAAPLVSGLAAIVKSYFPDYSALQVGEQLKVTADNIDTIQSNIPYAQQMGAGRVDLYRALTVTNLPSVKMLTENLPLASYMYLSKNDTLKITGDFINYLAPTSDLMVKITTTSPDVQIIDPAIDLGVIKMLETKNNNLSPFRILIKPSVQPNEQIIFKLNYTDNNYSAYQYFSIIVNADDINIDTNAIATTLTSTGNIGYNDLFETQGIGFTYKKGNSLMSCGGLLVGNSTNVSDNIYGPNHSLDNDFYSLINVKKIEPPKVSDFDATTVFNDSLAGVNALNVTVTQNTYAWNNPADSKYIICEYLVKNADSSGLSNLYVGFFMDWDINGGLTNFAAFDAADKLGYVFPVGGAPYGGVKILTPSPFNYYAFDNNGSNGSINIYDGFSNSEKFYALTHNRLTAGGTSGGDVSHILSAGPFNLNSQDTAKVAFAILAGDNLPDLQASAVAAANKYFQDTLAGIHEMNFKQIYLSQNYPNPFDNKTYIDVYLPSQTAIDLSVYNLLGEKILTIANNTFAAGNYEFTIDKNNLEKGFYFYRLITPEGSITKRMLMVK